jgi:diguanylate cyclase (GGDEF)-like protein
MSFPIPADEAERLGSLRNLFVLDSPAEDRFDRLTRLARKVFDAPMSMLTLIDEERQWFKSAQGHLVTETDRSGSFCQYTILGSDVMVVRDATKDELFQDMAVVRERGIRFYAGVPVYGPDSRRIGTFCILDTRCRDLSPEDIATLEDLARCAESELHLLSKLKVERRMLAEMDTLRRKASIDEITRCWNESVIRDLLGKVRAESPGDSGGGPAVLMVELARLGQVNAEIGSDGADALLRESAERLRAAAPANICLGRLRGGRFLMVFERLEAHTADAVGERVMSRLGGQPFVYHGRSVPLECHGGLAFHASPSESDQSLLERAEKALTRAKRENPGSFRRAV